MLSVGECTPRVKRTEPYVLVVRADHVGDHEVGKVIGIRCAAIPNVYFLPKVISLPSGFVFIEQDGCD